MKHRSLKTRFSKHFQSIVKSKMLNTDFLKKQSCKALADTNTHVTKTTDYKFYLLCISHHCKIYFIV